MNQLQGKNIDMPEGLEKEKYQKELKKQKDKKKKIIRDYLIMSAIIVVFVVLYFVFPAKGEVSLKNSWQFFIEMMEILPAVTRIIGSSGLIFIAACTYKSA